MLADDGRAFLIDEVDWSVLPSLALRGVGTALVESLPSYLMRLMWTTGITNIHLSEQLGWRKSRTLAKLGTFLSTREPELMLSAVDKLERLTGRDDLRFGTFWAMSHILSANSWASRGEYRRWCPKCYEDWNSESYEPLVWGVELLVRCPEHGCLLEHTCSSCGATQGHFADLDRRRYCRVCHDSLTKSVRWRRREPFLEWVDQQVMYLAKFCATPRDKPVPYSTYRDFVSGLRAVFRGRRFKSLRMLLRGYERAAMLRSQKVSIRSLINLCAIQGVSMRELLNAPREASAALRFDEWGGVDYLPLPTARQAQKIYVAQKHLLDFLTPLKPAYLPPMGLLLGGFGVQLLAIRDVATKAYDAYEVRYIRQGSSDKLKEARRAYLCARKIIGQTGFDEVPDVSRVAMKVARLAEVSLAVALHVAQSALRVRELRAEFRIRVYEAEMPLTDAVGWFIKNRRFL